MSALARGLLAAGKQVSGSDLEESPRVESLKKEGARIFLGHAAHQIGDAETVVISPAIGEENPELREARSCRIEVLSRVEMLARLVRSFDAICVAGSHGKTTTTAMLATILREIGLDPTFFLGAAAPSLGGVNGHLGTGKWAVVEACEAFHGLDALSPAAAIVTNITDEHLEHYESIAGLRGAFEDFLRRLPADGFALVCGDDPGAAGLFSRIEDRIIRYGFAPHNEVIIHIEETGGAGSIFRLEYFGRMTGRVCIGIPGDHNILDASACLGLALRMGLDFDRAAAALENFSGVEGRWQVRGTSAGIRIVEDFAHHPVEIEATLRMARSTLGREGRLVAVFQPQLFSRTARLHARFARALARADIIGLAEVDPSGEPEVSRVSSQLIAHELLSIDHTPLTAETPEGVARAVRPLLETGDLVVVMGAGRARSAAEELLRRVEDRSRNTGVGSRRECILSRILDHVVQCPQRSAIESVCGSLSYAALDAEVRCMGDRLAGEGIRRGDIVAVCLESSVEAVVAWLAILDLGGVFLPLDPAYPDRRLAFMLDDSRARLVLVNGETAGRGGLRGVRRLRIDPISGDRCRADFPARRMPVPHGDDPAYIIYTSGSTGRPKGVTIFHRALTEAIPCFCRRFEIGPSCKILQNTSLSFDVSVAEIFMALSSGACLCIPGRDHREPLGKALARDLADFSITHLALTPSLLSLLRPGDVPGLSHLIVAGEACPPDLVDTWAPRCTFFNVYGPTEATIYATAALCRPGEPVSIGTPIGETRVMILGEDRKPAAPGEIGELVLGGPSIAGGYVRRPELNAGCFLPDPLRGDDARLFRTGDMVRLRADGMLEFHGRNDGQLKIAGNRIEMGEVEFVLRKHPGVTDVVVVPHPGHGASLVAYFVPGEGRVPTGRDLKNLAEKELPRFMVPAEFIALAAIPLTPGGKVDRTALLRRGAAPGPIRRTLRTELPAGLERTLAEIWRDVLMLERLPGIDEDFFDLGGGSLLAARLVDEVETHLGIRLPLEILGRLSSVSGMARAVRAVTRDIPGVTAEAEGPDAGDIRRTLLKASLGWTGDRPHPDSLLVMMNPEGKGPPLIWCAQEYRELEILGQFLGPRIPLFGMLSGLNLITPDEEGSSKIASLYVDEISSLEIPGPVVLGGNCHGGAVARRIARDLRSRHQIMVSRLILMEQAGFPGYPGPISFLFGKTSFLNPYDRFGGDEEILRSCGPGSSIRIIPGGHGEYFQPPNIQALAEIIREELGRETG